MKWTSIFALCAAGFFAGACEQHPLPGEPPVREHGHAEEGKKHEGKTEGAAEPAKPADGAKAEESPKFFPEKK
jgi:hypothetical protein